MAIQTSVVTRQRVQREPRSGWMSTLRNTWRGALSWARHSQPGTPVLPSMPQRFGDYYRWPDGSWTHSG
jgi:hypothetical protein